MVALCPLMVASHFPGTGLPPLSISLKEPVTKSRFDPMTSSIFKLVAVADGETFTVQV